MSACLWGLGPTLVPCLRQGGLSSWPWTPGHTSTPTAGSQAFELVVTGTPCAPLVPGTLTPRASLVSSQQVACERLCDNRTSSPGPLPLCLSVSYWSCLGSPD